MSRVRRKRHKERERAVALPELVAERERRLARRRVIERHGRLFPDGTPVKCMPTRAELAGLVPRRTTPGNDGKVLFDSREAAEAAAVELVELGSCALRPYHCRRRREGHDGHWHLTVDGRAAREIKVAQQRARQAIRDRVWGQAS